jgi:hypothetical protein
MARTATEQRLARYVREYERDVWPNLPPIKITKDALFDMELRSDGWANAHVEGEHNANGICSCKTARECGERGAAAEYVECGDRE